MTRPANADAVRRGQAPANTDADPIGDVYPARYLRPLASATDVEQPPTPRPLPHADRLATYDVTTQPNATWGVETGMTEHVGGQHALIAFPIIGMQAGPGGQEPWRVDPRTLRNSPADTWDAGTAIGGAP